MLMTGPVSILNISPYFVQGDSQLELLRRARASAAKGLNDTTLAPRLCWSANLG